jgi:adsorption protein B
VIANDSVGHILVATKVLMGFCAVVFIISGLDDLFIDVCYAARAFYKRFYVFRRYQPLREEDMRSGDEQPLAVMIPAWDESVLIGGMLEKACQALAYTNYIVFVGTYANDVVTAGEVDQVTQAGYPVVRVALPHDGPTNKADCLNWIYKGIRRYEADHGTEFQIFVMQDCEDVIHPLCYRLFNLLIPRKDMVQLPVLSLQRGWRQFTGGHYVDEFAQLHYKDLVVRELLDRSLPAAGVGVGFSRRALEAVSNQGQDEIFDTKSLTQDYALSYRLKQLGMTQIFVKFYVTREVPEQGAQAAGGRSKQVRELVGVREYFPATFQAAVHQKSRWVMGASMQGWAKRGWSGGLSSVYMLYRDRKTLVTSPVTMLGYLVCLVALGVWMVELSWPDTYRFPPFAVPGSAFWYMLVATCTLMLFRIGQRAYCVGRLYGPTQSLLSLPRQAWGGIANIAATLRAMRKYSSHLRGRRPISWERIPRGHRAPGEAPAFRRLLGDVLRSRGLISAEQLAQGLAYQRRHKVRLGEALVQLGALSPQDLQRALGFA